MVTESKPERDPEEATDIEVADFLIVHIDGPCKVEVSPGKWEKIRHVYIDEAERLLKDTNFTDPIAKKKLEEKIKQYKP